MPRDPNDARNNKPLRGEEALIAEFWAPLAEDFPGALGLMDDCATITARPGEEIVVTTDALIAGVHFFPGDDPRAIGWKALAVNVSDLVAKGATPLAYLMSLALPELSREWLQAFAGGLRGAQKAFGCHLIGGDTDRTLGPLSVTIAALGTLPVGSMVRRSTARPGDHVYVSGTIGDAALGLALRLDPSLGAPLDAAARDYLERTFSRPSPPLALASILRQCASASIDISDGLMKDFDRLCRASGVGGHIEAPAVPLSQPARKILQAGSATLADLLSGGEDYGVLTTVSPYRATTFERLSAQSGCPVARIGTICEPHIGVAVLDAAGQPLVFDKMGWDHFHNPDAT